MRPPRLSAKGKAESGILVAERIVFEAAISAQQIAFFRGRYHPGANEDTDRDWHFLRGDQIIEDDRHTILILFLTADVLLAILKNHHAR